MGRSLPDPGFRVVRSNAAPDLEAARIGGKGCLRECIEGTLRAQGKWVFNAVEYKRKF